MPTFAENSFEALHEDRLDDICVALVNQGYCVLDAAVPAARLRALQQEQASLTAAELLAAGIGREQQHQQDRQVRGDHIHWLDRQRPAAADYLDFAESLRQGINRRLFLGLFDYECHYARYEPGAFYARHVDAFAGRRNRVLSTVLYLNEDWHESDGGELVLYDDRSDGELLRLLPQSNRMVLFLSERFPYEVLAARRSRCSIAGWYRVNPSDTQRVDPQR
jgi:SM-20-related protein